VLSLNNSLFCSVIFLISSQNQAFHQVHRSNIFQPYFKTVSRFQAAKFTAHSHNFFQSGLVSCLVGGLISCCGSNKVIISSSEYHSSINIFNSSSVGGSIALTFGTHSQSLIQLVFCGALFGQGNLLINSALFCCSIFGTSGELIIGFCI
jgi:hypothetical protein